MHIATITVHADGDTVRLEMDHPPLTVEAESIPQALIDLALQADEAGRDAADAVLAALAQIED